MRQLTLKPLHSVTQHKAHYEGKKKERKKNSFGATGCSGKITPDLLNLMSPVSSSTAGAIYPGSVTSKKRILEASLHTYRKATHKAACWCSPPPNALASCDHLRLVSAARPRSARPQYPVYLRLTDDQLKPSVCNSSSYSS